MPYLRRLPSGKWQATIRGADGKKHTKTDPLKKVVKDWAAEEETKVAQGRWRDPRQGRQTVGEWCAKWSAARVVEPSTRRGDTSTLKHHILPYWRDWRLFTITALDVQQWVRQLQKDGRNAPTVRKAYNLLATMLKDAVTAGVLSESPCRDIDRPATVPKLPAWFTREQVDRIRSELEHPTRVSPGGRRPGQHRSASVMVELMCCVGLRFGEATALVGGDRPDGNPVDWLRGRVRIIGALDQNGRWKEYPKTSRSRREVPAPAHCLAEMGELLVGRDRTARIFVTPRSGANVSGSNWRRIWYDAIDAASAADPIPRIDPHDCRHTAASWLAQDGVPLYEIQALLGHESAQTTQRYAHLQAGAHARVEDAWTRILAHQRRTGPRKAGGDTA